jgi:hypothetical protein
MTTIKKEVKNCKVMISELCTSVSSLFTERLNSVCDEYFNDVKTDDCESRSRGIDIHSRVATEALNLIPTLADVNWEVFVEKLSDHDLKYLKHALGQKNSIKT